MSDRIKKVNEVLKETLSRIIGESFQPENTLITVTDVKTSPDLRQAQVFVSSFPYEKKEEILKFLRENLSKIQEELGNNIELKYTPKIEIIFDDSLQQGDEMDKLFEEIRRDTMNR